MSDSHDARSAALIRQVYDLASQCLSGEASQDQVDKFEVLLLENEDARETFAEFIQESALLHVWATEIPTEDAKQPAAGEEDPTRSANLSGDSTRPPRRTVREFIVRPTPLSITVAALVIGLLLTAMALMTPPFFRSIVRPDAVPHSGDAVAQVTGLHEAAWPEGHFATRIGMSLQKGRRIVLDSGVVEITHRDGAAVTLQGPCNYVIEDVDSGTLHVGRLLATVPKSAVGYHVNTSAATITDLGTQFGVHVTFRGDVEVHVMAGKVRAQPHVGQRKEAVELVAGDTLRFDGNWRNVAISEDELRSWQALARATDIKRLFGVTIYDFSSEMVHDGFDRRAVHLIDASGLAGAEHSPYPDAETPGGTNPGTMWLTNGTKAEPADPLPAHVTFDLGDVYELTGMHVWNYNEQTRGLHSRGAREVEISVSATDNPGDFIALKTKSGNFEFLEADGSPQYRGFPVPLAQATNSDVLKSVRLVRFTILSTHGPNPQEDVADLAGLSEVRFWGRRLK